MRTSILTALAVLLAPSLVCAASAPAKEEHPGEVALLQDGDKWTYKHFPTNLRLYVFDDDKPDESNCYKACSAVWPPLIAHENPKPMGDWSLVKRTDGGLQWAYKKRPVYVRYHDSVEQPTGNGADGNKWHFLEP
jgi:predicted lipoprotein with Yx(FWY)xxD motif